MKMLSEIIMDQGSEGTGHKPFMQIKQFHSHVLKVIVH